MRLFIQIKDGQPHEHPIMDWNMRDAFPDVDLDNLPENFANFIRVNEPDVPFGEYEVPYLSHYDWDGSNVKDMWSVRQMTQEEIDAVNAMKHLLEIARQKEESLSIDSSGSVPDVA